MTFTVSFFLFSKLVLHVLHISPENGGGGVGDYHEPNGQAIRFYTLNLSVHLAWCPKKK